MPYYTNHFGQRLFYEDIGEGEVLLFIHPPGMGRKVFKQQHELADHYRLIFPDLSGHGDSDTTDLSPSLEDFASEIKQLMDHLSIEQIILVGYSAGGAVAQYFALQYPKKAKALILSGAFPKVDTFFLWFEFFMGIKWVKRSPGSLAMLLSKSHFRRPEFKQELRNHMAKSDPEVWREFYKQALKHDCRHDLAKLEMPLLLMYGERAVWINHHACFYRECPDATLVIVDRALHQLPATHGPIINQSIINFIERKVGTEKKAK
ncbi:alpha/beta fold hydrolase [Halobacillus amylolyticus]|uniref:Alpha/beta hydrolase n=1 Tax=Halobacillus amylolyticus TaxID=2932259 RepID=A0ABY4H7B7_9BACI|nr:alpha/beta hydrolase [Halobacillus amylolyticus]UOR10426.1 alpha/beta hydrolase [Halobacillus amylolyticus]